MAWCFGSAAFFAEGMREFAKKCKTFCTAHQSNVTVGRGPDLLGHVTLKCGQGKGDPEQKYIYLIESIFLKHSLANEWAKLCMSMKNFDYVAGKCFCVDKLVKYHLDTSRCQILDDKTFKSLRFKLKRRKYVR